MFVSVSMQRSTVTFLSNNYDSRPESQEVIATMRDEFFFTRDRTGQSVK